MGLKPCHGHRSLHPASRAAIDANVLWLMRFQYFPIYARHIFTGCGKLVFRTFSIVDANYLDFPQRGHRNGFEFRTSGPTTRKSAPVKIDEDSILVSCRNSP